MKEIRICENNGNAAAWLLDTMLQTVMIHNLDKVNIAKNNYIISIILHESERFIQKIFFQRYLCTH